MQSFSVSARAATLAVIAPVFLAATLAGCSGGTSPSAPALAQSGTQATLTRERVAAAVVAAASTPVPVLDSRAPAIFLTDNPAIVLGNLSTYGIVGTTTTAPIDGIPCTGPLKTLSQHIHVHLTLFVNGKQYAIPVAIGIHHPVRLYGNPNTIIGWFNISATDPKACHYDMHVHAGDGVIHMETASATQAFYLKDLLDIWGVSLSPSGFWRFSGPTRWFQTDERVGPAGSYQVKEITGTDPATIQFTRHTEFTIEVGTPLVAIPNYTFIESQL